LRRSLLDEEIVFIFDFLIELFKYAEINDEIAISLGTHLVNDFYQMSFNSFSIKNDKVIQNNELLAINFEM
jgi:hypothetical protein